MITLENTRIGYSGKPLLDSINLDINENEFWGIIGPNGGGKSTLLKTILGLIPKLSGQIDYSPKCSFGYVPQREVFDKIFPISVKELVMMGRYSKIGFGRKIRNSDKEIAGQCLDEVGIYHLKDRTFRSLSGGELQRALIARAIAGGPSVLVLDEPTASVDMKGEREIMDLVRRVQIENKLTVLMVTHFINTVSKFADKLILIDKDRGVFEQGSVKDFIDSKILNEIFGMNFSMTTYEIKR